MVYCFIYSDQIHKVKHIQVSDQGFNMVLRINLSKYLHPLVVIILRLIPI